MKLEPPDQSGLGVIEFASEAERCPKPEIGPIPRVRSVSLSEEVLWSTPGALLDGEQLYAARQGDPDRGLPALRGGSAAAGTGREGKNVFGAPPRRPTSR